jgi:hypothetical protein
MPTPSFLLPVSGSPHKAPGTQVVAATDALKMPINVDKGKAPMKENKVPRPPNGFILYRQHHHQILKAGNPDLRNNDICKFSS